MGEVVADELDKQLDMIDFVSAMRVQNEVPGYGSERIVEIRLKLEDKAKQAIKALIAKAVVEARIELYNLYGEPRCENLHHPKKWQHKALEDCPVVQAIEQLNTDKEVV